LSTHAKFLPLPQADVLFELAYQKFGEALKVGKEENYIICNWGMTLINQARKNLESNLVEAYNGMLLLVGLSPA